MTQPSRALRVGRDGNQTLKGDPKPLALVATPLQTHIDALPQGVERHIKLVAVAFMKKKRREQIIVASQKNQSCVLFKHSPTTTSVGHILPQDHTLFI